MKRAIPILILILLSTVAYAQETDGGITPNQVFLWKIDKGFERIRLLFAGNEKKVEIYEKILAEREAERNAMEKINNTKALERISESKVKLREQLQKHITVLQEVRAKLLEKNNTNALKGIDNALSKSSMVILRSITSGKR